MMRKQEKAQAGMEYLLILGTAVLVTAVVIMSVPSSLNTGKTVIVDSNTAVVSSLDKLRELEMGSGTYSNPWIINNCAGLQGIRDHLDAHYVLGADIDCSDSKNWNNNNGFDPIAKSSLDIDWCQTDLTDPVNPDPDVSQYWDRCLPQDTQFFSGTLDGRGHTIKNFFINRPNENFVGLFGLLGETGKVSNITFIDANVTGKKQVAAVTGMDYGGEIDGVIVKGIIKGTQFVGAIAGTASDTNDTRHKGIISNSGSEGTVTAIVSRAGGVVGNGHYFILDESYSKSNVDANYEAGGLAGTVWFGTTITRSYATGNVHAAYDIAGGLVSGAHGLISNSYATGNVSGIANVGGLMGVGGAIILNSYSTGNVNGTNYFGGLIGYTIGDIDNSFTISSVNIDAGDTNFGGLAGIVGDNWGGGAYNSFWDINNTTQPKAYAYYDHVPTGHGNNDYGRATGINTTPKDYAYWYDSNNLPLSSWGGFGADKNWSNCENSTLPWLTWESRNCQRTE